MSEFLWVLHNEITLRETQLAESVANCFANDYFHNMTTIPENVKQAPLRAITLPLLIFKEYDDYKNRHALVTALDLLSLEKIAGNKT